MGRGCVPSKLRVPAGHWWCVQIHSWLPGRPGRLFLDPPVEPPAAPRPVCGREWCLPSPAATTGDEKAVIALSGQCGGAHSGHHGLFEGMTSSFSRRAVGRPTTAVGLRVGWPSTPVSRLCLQPSEKAAVFCQCASQYGAVCRTPPPVCAFRSPQNGLRSITDGARGSHALARRTATVCAAVAPGPLYELPGQSAALLRTLREGVGMSGPVGASGHPTCHRTTGRGPNQHACQTPGAKLAAMRPIGVDGG